MDKAWFRHKVRIPGWEREGTVNETVRAGAMSIEERGFGFLARTLEVKRV